jgi:hypothetical protein
MLQTRGRRHAVRGRRAADACGRVRLRDVCTLIRDDPQQGGGRVRAGMTRRRRVESACFVEKQWIGRRIRSAVPVGRRGAVLVRSFLVRAFHSRAALVLVGRLGETRQQHTSETKVGRRLRPSVH